MAYEKGACGLGSIVKAANNAKAQNRYNSDGVGIYRQWPATDLISESGCSDHGNELNTGKNQGHEEGILVASVLNYFAVG